MAIVEIEKPQIVTFSYRQTKDDADYGSCLWARFYFDTQTYTMFVESDCGGYSYGWVPTPKSETFLHLMARCDSGYILDKIASRSVIDEDATYQSIVDYLDFRDECNDECVSFTEKLRDACRSYDDDRGIADEIMGVCVEFEILYEEYEIYRCIEHDYPAGAKKIAEIFEKHIVQAIRKMEK